mmetsp:Transcript_6083/g.18386  ORF Transcript_6083/g.18386 Transcript_6083/m.18386 type:complete len:410 (+) Transcript_6083:238-1467(+)
MVQNMQASSMASRRREHMKMGLTPLPLAQLRPPITGLRASSGEKARIPGEGKASAHELLSPTLWSHTPTVPTPMGTPSCLARFFSSSPLSRVQETPIARQYSPMITNPLTPSTANLLRGGNDSTGSAIGSKRGNDMDMATVLSPLKMDDGNEQWPLPSLDVLEPQSKERRRREDQTDIHGSPTVRDQTSLGQLDRASDVRDVQAVSPDSGKLPASTVVESSNTMLTRAEPVVLSGVETSDGKAANTANVPLEPPRQTSAESISVGRGAVVNSMSSANTHNSSLLLNSTVPQPVGVAPVDEQDQSKGPAPSSYSVQIVPPAGTKPIPPLVQKAQVPAIMIQPPGYVRMQKIITNDREPRVIRNREAALRSRQAAKKRMDDLENENMKLKNRAEVLQRYNAILQESLKSAR